MVCHFYRLYCTEGLSDDGSRNTRSTKRDKSQAGVIEAFPGIIESTNIDPLHKDFDKGLYRLDVCDVTHCFVRRSAEEKFGRFRGWDGELQRVAESLLKRENGLCLDLTKKRRRENEVTKDLCTQV